MVVEVVEVENSRCVCVCELCVCVFFLGLFFVRDGASSYVRVVVLFVCVCVWRVCVWKWCVCCCASAELPIFSLIDRNDWYRWVHLNVFLFTLEFQDTPLLVSNNCETIRHDETMNGPILESWIITLKVSESVRPKKLWRRSETKCWIFLTSVSERYIFAARN